MKILQILPSLKQGGVETGTLDLAQELIKNGHQSYVISSGGGLVKPLEKEGTNHFLWPVERKSLLSVFRLTKRLAAFIEKNKIDIVHARSRVPGWIAYFACRKTKTKFITTCHGHYRPHLASSVMAKGERVIVASQSIKNHLKNSFRVPEENLAFIPRGVNLQNFNFSPKKLNDLSPTIGIIARLTPLKGHLYFLEALAKLKNQYPSIKALIIGKGKPKYLTYLKQLAKNLKLEDWVSFSSHVENVAKSLEEMDVLVLPTITPEAFGRVIIEAQAVGVPVVATKVGGIVDIIEDKKTGLLVPPKNSPKIAEAVSQLLNDPELVESIQIKARERVERLYTSQQMCQKTITLYQRVVQEKKILIIKFGALGDIILISPSLRAIREKYPLARIELLTDPQYTNIFKECPYLDQIITFKRKAGYHLSQLVKLSREIKRKNFDISIDFQNNKLSHLISFCSSIPQRIGYPRGLGKILLNKRVIDYPLSPLKHQFKLLKEINIEEFNPELELWPTAENETKAAKLIPLKGRPLIGLNMGASPRWLTKLWPIEHFAKLAKLLTEELNAQIFLTGTTDDLRRGDNFLNLACHNIIGKTSPLDLYSVIKRLNLFITNDTAPLHLAAAANTPTIAFFGPTSSARHAVPSANLFIFQKKFPCRPCYKTRCKELKCLKEISPEEVFNFIKEKIL